MARKDNGDLLQVVVFKLEEKSLGVDILQVQEILRYVEITPFPKMPPFALGVINLRGQIVPVINIRTRLNLPDRLPSLKTCIMLVKVLGTVLGFVVDEIDEVLSLPKSAIDRPETGPEWVRTELFSGVGKLPGRLLVIINSDHLLSAEETRLLQNTGAPA